MNDKAPPLSLQDAHRILSHLRFSPFDTPWVQCFVHPDRRERVVLEGTFSAYDLRMIAGILDRIQTTEEN